MSYLIIIVSILFTYWDFSSSYTVLRAPKFQFIKFNIHRFRSFFRNSKCASTAALQSVEYGGGGKEPKTEVPFEDIRDSLSSIGLSETKINKLIVSLRQSGFESTSELLLLSKDYINTPESLASMLHNDFGLPMYDSHILRATLFNFLASKHNLKSDAVHFLSRDSIQGDYEALTSYSSADKSTSQKAKSIMKARNSTSVFKSFIVSEKTKMLKQSSIVFEYGLKEEDMSIRLASMLESFFIFMTEISMVSQEPPLRKATADVYLRHVKLFLGWYLTDDSNFHRRPNINKETLVIQDIFPSRDKESAAVVFTFIKWLRFHRKASVSYEANVVRGLTKFAKFRFANESQVEISSEGKSFEDIPVIKELRKLHRDANKKQKLSPRVNDEQKKWISWTEFLGVVESAKNDWKSEYAEYQSSFSASETKSSSIGKTKRQKLAYAFQKFLILAMFSSVPDRQRTFRELALGSTFLRDAEGSWVIKHGPNDYKTGGSYGDRPPLVLPKSLTSDIDEFIDRWRVELAPTTNCVFVQSRGGSPLTADSIYTIVSKTCFQYTGKRTNPHLLRDMIVTHVREGSASEKELEALALYMGHSLSMQRTSYDRRTLKQKVAPAVELLRSINEKSQKI